MTIYIIGKTLKNFQKKIFQKETKNYCKWEQDVL